MHWLFVGLRVQAALKAHPPECCSCHGTTLTELKSRIIKVVWGCRDRFHTQVITMADSSRK